MDTPIKDAKDLISPQKTFDWICQTYYKKMKSGAFLESLEIIDTY